MAQLPRHNSLQVIVHSEETGGVIARFAFKRKDLMLLAGIGAREINGFIDQHGVSATEAGGAAMRAMRVLLTTATPEDLEGKRGTILSTLTVWYIMFRYRSGYLKNVRLKRVEAVHVYYLAGNNPDDPDWPLIKIGVGRYEPMERKQPPLPELGHLDIWAT